MTKKAEEIREQFEDFYYSTIRSYFPENSNYGLSFVDGIYPSISFNVLKILPENLIKELIEKFKELYGN